MMEARHNTDRDLLRFRMGGWTEFAVAMFPNLLEQQIRRVRSVPDNIDKDIEEITGKRERGERPF